MFDFYRFIKSRYSTVADILAQQANKQNLSIRAIDKFDGNDDNKNRITVIVVNDVIVDIYKG